MSGKLTLRVNPAFEMTASASNKAPTAAPPQQELAVLLLEEAPRNLLDVEGHHDVVTFRLLRSLENTARCGLVSDLGKHQPVGQSCM